MLHQPKDKIPPRAEVERFAEDMAREARLLDNPLPKDTDYTDEEMKEIQSRVRRRIFARFLCRKSH